MAKTGSSTPARAPNRRSLWQGQLRLSLVSVPVELFPATQADEGAKPRRRRSG